MSEGWKYVELGSVARVQGGFAFKSNDFSETGIPVAKIKNVKSLEIDLTDCGYVDEDTAKSAAKYYAKNGDILISMTGSGANAPNSIVGRVARNLNSDNSFLINQRVGRFRIKAKDKLDKDFLYYYLSPKRRQWELVSIATGSANQVNISGSQIESLIIPLPKIETQQKVSKVLNSIDQKIHLLRQQNATLEAMAQALFKSWFVDFDPVVDNALEAGRVLPEALAGRVATRRAVLAAGDYPVLPEGVRGLFPEGFVFSEELGRWVPEGWEVKSFGSLLESAIGGDWGKEVPDEKHTEKSVIIRGTDMATLELGGQSKAPTRFVEPKKLATRILQDGDIILEISGGSPTQSTGRSMRITSSIISRLGGTVEPASFCRKFRPVDKLTGLFAAHHLKHLYDRGDMWSYQVQSTGIANFQTTYFLENEILPVPVNQLLEKFAEQVLPLAKKKSEDQIISLTRLRDVLLPELISGRLVV